MLHSVCTPCRSTCGFKRVKKKCFTTVSKEGLASKCCLKMWIDEEDEINGKFVKATTATWVYRDESQNRNTR